MTNSPSLTRRNTMMVRWSICSSGSIVLFWTTFWIINGYIPAVSGIQLTETIILAFPIAISRLWDAVLIALAVTAVIFTVKKDSEFSENACKNFFGLTSLCAMTGLMLTLITNGPPKGPLPAINLGLLIGGVSFFVFAIALFMSRITTTERERREAKVNSQTSTFSFPLYLGVFAGTIVGTTIISGSTEGIVMATLSSGIWLAGVTIIEFIEHRGKKLWSWLIVST